MSSSLKFRNYKKLQVFTTPENTSVQYAQNILADRLHNCRTSRCFPYTLHTQSVVQLRYWDHCFRIIYGTICDLRHRLLICRDCNEGSHISNIDKKSCLAKIPFRKLPILVHSSGKRM